MIEIRKTDLFAHWIDELGNIQARARVQVGEGVSELGINYGPGYQVYFKQSGRERIILLAGGDKRTQTKDMKTALRLARDL